MSRSLVAYPFATIPQEAVRWGEWTLAAPLETTLSALPNSWDYSQDLVFQSDVWVDMANILGFLGVTSMATFKVTVEVFCRSSAWRTSTSFSLESATRAMEGQFHIPLQVDVPGSCVDDHVQITVFIVGPAQVPGVGKVISGAKLAVGPTTRILLRPNVAQLPVSIVSFADVGWRAAPWRFVLQTDTLHDAYAACVRLYVNADLAVSDELTSTSAGPSRNRLLNTVRFDVLRNLLQQLHQLRLDPRITAEFDSVSEMAENSVGYIAEALAQKHLGYGLSTALDRLHADPVTQEQRLAASVHYHGETRPR